MILPPTQTTLPAPAPQPKRPLAAALSDRYLDDLLADPNLNSTAKAIAITLVKKWAWGKSFCWPSDKKIAAAVDKSVGYTRRV